MPIRPTSGTETRDQDGSEPKCATNVSLKSRLYAEARARRWLDENLAALQSSNAYVERQGLPLARYRRA
jgi:post-segregation antitoxin (ccd killing protein)